MTLSSRSPAGRILIAFACLVGLLFVALLTIFGSGYVRIFYLPSEGMAPTLEKHDRIVATMDGAESVRRGEIILFPVGDAIYVKRVAGLPGDTIGMRRGIVILNGLPVTQRFLKHERRADPDGTATARRLAEQFPGEATPHEILDQGQSPADDIPERRVPADHLFVLGDHRDRSADSRFSRGEMGVDLLPVRDVKGHALFYAWPPAKMGAKLNP